MITTARSLESAEKNAESYTGGNMAAMQATLPVLPPSEENVVAAAKSSSAQRSRSNKNGCWNCGQSRHPQSRCPARDAVCHSCERIGHFSKMCRSSKKSAAIASEEDQSNSTTASAIFAPQLL